MSTPTEIIDKFDGTRAMAKTLGIAPSTVQSWKDSGVIPARRQRDVLDAAQRLGINLSASDLIPTPEPEGEAA